MKTNKKPILKITYISLLALLPLILGGCAGVNYVWYQPAKNAAAFGQDHLQCEEEAALYAKHMNKRGDRDVISGRMKECMEIRGYAKLPENELPKGAPGFKDDIE